MTSPPSSRSPEVGEQSVGRFRVRKASFAEALRLDGPSAARSLSLPEAQRLTRDLATSHYENFPVLTKLLPRPMRQPIADVYAFSRWADDLGDEVVGAESSLELLAWWQDELDAAVAGSPRHPVMVALAESIRSCRLSREPFDDLLDAFRQDQTQATYETNDQLLDYCRRSANPVGRLVLAIGDAATDENIAASDRICTGLQLANFWQDVARDAAIGRRYLPAETMTRYAIEPGELAAATTSDRLAAALFDHVVQARSLLQSGAELPRRLPLRLGLVVDLFRRGGLAICDRIEQSRYRVLERRPTVTKGDAIRELRRAITERVLRRSG